MGASSGCSSDVMPHKLRSLTLRLGLTMLGGLCFGLGIVMNVQANVGQAPWVAFHYGLTLHTPLPLGQANVAVGVLMIAISFFMGVPPGLGTLLSVAVVGGIVDALLLVIPRMDGLVDGYAMLVVSVLVMTLGTALMVKARLGIGPRDSFMLALSSITGLRIGLVKSGVEFTAFVLGVLMGAPPGIGTVVYVLASGPAIELWFRVFGLRAPRRRQTAVTERGVST